MLRVFKRSPLPHQLVRGPLLEVLHLGLLLGGEGDALRLIILLRLPQLPPYLIKGPLMPLKRRLRHLGLRFTLLIAVVGSRVLQNVHLLDFHLLQIILRLLILIRILSTYCLLAAGTIHELPQLTHTLLEILCVTIVEVHRHFISELDLLIIQLFNYKKSKGVIIIKGFHK